MNARRRTQAEIAQLVLDTPGMVTRLAVNCTEKSPTLNKLPQGAQIDAFNELRDLVQRELERIAREGPRFCPRCSKQAVPYHTATRTALTRTEYECTSCSWSSREETT